MNPHFAGTIQRCFDFERDTFAFANELVWEYQFDSASGKTIFAPREKKSDYAHRCFVLTRAARQFFFHARFDAGQKIVGDQNYRDLIRNVVSRNPRRPCAPENKIAIPGYANLREFSAAKEKLLKAECGGAWQSYILRSHWRMIFPISRAHQKQTAEHLAAVIANHFPPIIHLVKFPALTINHGMLLFEAAGTENGFEFAAYDPNEPKIPARMSFDRARGTFFLPANSYWAGGELNVIEIYRNFFL